MRLKKILCATDFSDFSRDAFRAALDEAVRHDASVTLLHAYHMPLYGYTEGIVAPKFLAVLAREAGLMLADWKASAAGERDVPIETLAREGAAWNEICRTALDGGYDLIVVGSHGRTGLAHVMAGSVAEKVVRHAPCPVLVWRARMSR